MPAKGIRIDGSFNCAIRTTSTIVTAKGTEPPQPVPTRPMHGRRCLRIMNNGRGDLSLRTDIQVMIGSSDASADPIGPGTIIGFGLNIDEFIELPFDDSILVHAVAVIPLPPEATVDLRTIELR